MRYVKIATCAAILLSGAASANLAFAGSNKPSSPPGASIVTPAEQMKGDQIGSPAPHGASTFTPGHSESLPATGGASLVAPGRAIAPGKHK
jgi:hypothetical protein